MIFRFRGSFNSLVKLTYGLPQGSPLSVKPFRVLPLDHPLDALDIVFMDNCASFHVTFTNLIQDRLNEIMEWTNTNRVFFYPGKFKVLMHRIQMTLQLTMKGTLIPVVDKVKYLDITSGSPTAANQPFSFDAHIDEHQNVEIPPLLDVSQGNENELSGLNPWQSLLLSATPRPPHAGSGTQIGENFQICTENLSWPIK